MSDDFGTVNIKGADRGHQIELMRQHYRQHRDALARMTAEAPTARLAGEYQKLVRDIQASLRKLDELEGQPEALDETLMDETARAANASMSNASMFPIPTPRSAGDVLLSTGSALPAQPVAAGSGSRVMLILLAGVVVLALIGWVIYRASSERRHPPAAADATVANETMGTNPNPTGTSVPETTSSAAKPAAMALTPASADYGTIRKGTRAVRPFVVRNTSKAPIQIAVSRSACKCLYYEYRPLVPPGGKETITVTIDGARAPVGPLNETVQVSLKKEPSITTTFHVMATIR